jgi:hypothetical protein
MRKKAQVTIFIIIAILIIAIIILFFIFRDKIELGGGIDSEFEPVYNFVQDCIEETGGNALERIGEQGGYFFIPDSVPSIDSRIPYYINNKDIYFPDQEDIQNSLSGFVYEELSFCILNFKDFRSYEIEHELSSVETEINENGVIFNLNYPISIRKGETTEQLKDFEIKLPVRLGIVYDTAYKIVDEQRTHFDSICLSCLYDLGEENEVHIDMLDYGADTTIFTIIDDKSQLNGESYEFNFVIQYE